MNNKLESRKKSLLDTFNAFEEAYFTDRDLKKTLSFIGENLTGYGTGDNEDLSEKGKYIELFERDMKAVSKPIIHKREYAKTDMISEDIGFINTVTNLEVESPNGEILHFRTRASHLFVHDGERWIMRHLHASEPSPFQQPDEAYSFKVLQKKNIELEHLIGKRTYELKKAIDARDLMMQEVHHRIKNNMSTIHAMLSLHSYTVESESSSVLQEAASRIKSMITLYDYLYKNEQYEKMNVAEYLRQLLKGIRKTLINNDISIFENIDDAVLSVDDVFYIGILANELLTNACKHAYPHGGKGPIFLTFHPLENNQGWILSIADEGLPMQSLDEETHGFGLTLIKAISEQLKGTIDIINLEKGKKIVIKKASGN